MKKKEVAQMATPFLAKGVAGATPDFFPTPHFFNIFLFLKKK
jgi:hypothetical protein